MHTSSPTDSSENDGKGIESASETPSSLPPTDGSVLGDEPAFVPEGVSAAVLEDAESVAEPEDGASADCVPEDAASAVVPGGASATVPEDGASATEPVDDGGDSASSSSTLTSSYFCIPILDARKGSSDDLLPKSSTQTSPSTQFSLFLHRVCLLGVQIHPDLLKQYVYLPSLLIVLHSLGFSQSLPSTLLRSFW
ncbi:unnamed protein product [Agarophyton chilense]